MATETEIRELTALAYREDSGALIMHFLDQRAAGNPDLARAYVNGALQTMQKTQSALSTLAMCCFPFMLFIVGIPLYFWISKIKKNVSQAAGRLTDIFSNWKARTATA